MIPMKSMARKTKPRSKSRFPMPTRRADALALCILLGLAGVAIAGPSGLFAWSENLRLKESREARLAKLTTERDRLQNRVDLLDPERADPDLAGELIRGQMGVVHPDEVVIAIPD